MLHSMMTKGSGRVLNINDHLPQRMCRELAFLDREPRFPGREKEKGREKMETEALSETRAWMSTLSLPPTYGRFPQLY